MNYATHSYKENIFKERYLSQATRCRAINIVKMSHKSDQKKFQEEFRGSEYIQNYISRVDFSMVKRYVIEKTASDEAMRIMMFLNEVCQPLISSNFKNKPSVLELGGGPTIYQLMNIAEDIKSVYFTDFVEDNLDEIRKWKEGSKKAFNWKPYFKAALMLKNDTDKISETQIRKLEQTLRNKINKIGYCDVFKKNLGIAGNEKFDIINTHFVAESATKSKSKWSQAINNMYSKLNNGGLIFMSALRGAKGYYGVLSKKFPAVELYEDDVKKAMKNAKFELIRIFSIHTEARGMDYEGFMFIIAKK